MITNHNSVISLKKGEIIQSYGEYTILQGYILCLTGKHLIRIIKEGGSFIVTEENFIGKLVHYQAQDNVRIACHPNVSPTYFLQKQGEAQQEMMQAFVHQLDIYALPVKNRVMVFWFRMACEIGVYKEGDCYVPAVLTQVEMAKYSHCTRVYLNGVCQALIKDGWLIRGKEWTLIDWKRWETYASGLFYTNTKSRLIISE
ncbi:Crp/Fnr family transcriptional regulator [Listeria booriae]|nr:MULTISPECIES: Crp/Fnr family transcriptional regulator [Listeria]MBC1334708.1 Crp/Fnr family transcriptional regulator [Listeria booriae]MBC1435952.1 Crp/Fnr family transcriptional regulator [Listeria rocourtiae]MBC1943581.1 Crp/Fnr family transcriptional regulator [Listeria booriae]MBC6130019.1 Crp/Fnr family transcriptional regulator [Listeria booriae]MBC6166977.1 Crp/Fnr family transcriptional regulator [Listeria booriae]